MAMHDSIDMRGYAKPANDIKNHVRNVSGDEVITITMKASQWGELVDCSALRFLVSPDSDIIEGVGSFELGKYTAGTRIVVDALAGQWVRMWAEHSIAPPSREIEFLAAALWKFAPELVEKMLTQWHDSNAALEGFMKVLAEKDPKR